MRFFSFNLSSFDAFVGLVLWRSFGFLRSCTERLIKAHSKQAGDDADLSNMLIRMG